MNQQSEVTVPGFQFFMSSFLKVLSDGKTKQIRTIVDEIVELEKLTPEQCAVKLDTQSETQVVTRIFWARTYLFKAGLIEQVSRGNYKITEEGLSIHQNKKDRVDTRFLKTLPKFIEWEKTFKGNKSVIATEKVIDNDEVRAPLEQMNLAYLTIMRDVADDLLNKVKGSSPAFFENLVLEVLLAMGYGGFDVSNGEVTQYSNDGGIDGIIKEDKLGLDKIYIQAKKWENTVTISAVRDFAGSLLSKKARKGVFITTSTFPQSAYDFVKSIDPTIILIDGEQLTKMMIEYGVGVSKDKTFEIKKVDNDYFEF